MMAKWESAQGGHPRQEGGEGTAQQTHAAGASAVHLADLERARDRVAAAERRIDNDRRSSPNRGHTGLERA
jgi:hypothetical protein